MLRKIRYICAIALVLSFAVGAYAITIPTTTYSNRSTTTQSLTDWYLKDDHEVYGDVIISTYSSSSSSDYVYAFVRNSDGNQYSSSAHVNGTGRFLLRYYSEVEGYESFYGDTYQLRGRPRTNAGTITFSGSFTT